MQREHFPTFEIALNHIFLLVAHEQEFHIATPLGQDFPYFHWFPSVRLFR